MLPFVAILIFAISYPIGTLVVVFDVRPEAATRLDVEGSVHWD